MGHDMDSLLIGQAWELKLIDNVADSIRRSKWLNGDQKIAINALKAAEPEIMRGVTVGVLHKNTASRKVSRLAARVKGMAA